MDTAADGFARLDYISCSSPWRRARDLVRHCTAKVMGRETPSSSQSNLALWTMRRADLDLTPSGSLWGMIDQILLTASRRVSFFRSAPICRASIHRPCSQTRRRPTHAEHPG